MTDRDTTPPALEVDRLLDDPRTRIIVCCGSGGVGKTTTAAARGKLDSHELGLGLKAAGLDGSLRLNGGLDVATALTAELGEHALEVLTQRKHRHMLSGTGQPCYELPLITDGMDLAGLYRLAAALQEQGAA